MKVLIYTKNTCPHCTRAKALFNKKNIPFEEKDITNDPEGQCEMVKKSNGKKSVPQIFIDGKSIGGCDDLYELYQSGKLGI